MRSLSRKYPCESLVQNCIAIHRQCRCCDSCFDIEFFFYVRSILSLLRAYMLVSDEANTRPARSFYSSDRGGSARALFLQRVLLCSKLVQRLASKFHATWCIVMYEICLLVLWPSVEPGVTKSGKLLEAVFLLLSCTFSVAMAIW